MFIEQIKHKECFFTVAGITRVTEIWLFVLISTTMAESVLIKILCFITFFKSEPLRRETSKTEVFKNMV